MTNMRINAAETGNLTNTYSDYAVNSAEQDFPGTDYTTDWAKWYGYYKAIPELQSVIDKKGYWIVGKGFKLKKGKKEILEKIKGNGKDSFNSILNNAVRTYTICGDFFAEIIKNKRGELVNLKPINSGSITIKTNEKGVITGYEQNIYTNGKKITYSPNEIFHLCWQRLGDEGHGISTIQKIEQIILMRNEAMTDMKIVFHRYVKPLNIFKLDTDDPSEIAAFKAKQDAATANTENMYIPKDSVEVERVSIPQYSTLDPLPWIKLLNQYFIMAEGVPEVILGYGRDTTEASSKILYLAFQQMIEFNQLFIEEQIKLQLGIEIELEFPADISPELKQDVGKERNVNNFEMEKDVKEIGVKNK